MSPWHCLTSWHFCTLVMRDFCFHIVAFYAFWHHSASSRTLALLHLGNAKVALLRSYHFFSTHTVAFHSTLALFCTLTVLSCQQHYVATRHWQLCVALGQLDLKLQFILLNYCLDCFQRLNCLVSPEAGCDCSFQKQTLFHGCIVPAQPGWSSSATMFCNDARRRRNSSRRGWSVKPATVAVL